MRQRPQTPAARHAPGMSRRSFLQLTAALGAAAGPLASLPRLPALASTLLLHLPHAYFADPQVLLGRGLAGFDALLVPAYAAAELIRREALHTLLGPPGRAHDPEGAFSLVHSQRVGALIYRGQAPASLEDLWKIDAVWPDSARLAIGAALMRRGYSPSDTHPGHLAQAEADLLTLRPRLASDPAAAVRAGQTPLALAAVSLMDLVTGSGPSQPADVFSLPDGLWARLPAEGAILAEYDWVLPRGGSHPEAALALVKRAFGLPRDWPDRRDELGRLISLSWLPARAQAEYAALWARVKSRLQRSVISGQ